MTRPRAEPPSGESADRIPPPPRYFPGEALHDEVLMTAKQRRKAAREEKRQAKDAAYDLRQKRKKEKDIHSWHGHHIVDSKGLAEAFPEPETPEIPSSTVRRRITHGVILVLLLAMVATGLVLAGMVQRGELELKFSAGKPTPTPAACPGETLDYPANKTVRVNVYNGGAAEGRAGQVAQELMQRSFAVGEVANKASEYSAPVVIVSGAKGHAAAFNMQRNFSLVADGSEYVQDGREDASVDVILTSQFQDLVAVPKVDQKPGVLFCPRLSPPPSAPASPGTPASPGATALKKP
ncbi:LytR C-terminal domain-containing protein [Arthrobacter sp. HLT1-20]